MIVGLLLLATAAVLVRFRPHPTPEPQRPERGPAPASGRLVVPDATSTGTPASVEVITRHSSVTLPWEAEPTPSPTAPEPSETPSPRPEASVTPAIAECVAIRWSSEMSPVNIGQVLVEIHAENRCGRDLDPLDVWFEVAGYRNGDLIQTARGHLFDPLWRDSEGKATIGLPGSADWYDRMDVRVIGSGGP